MYNLKLVNSNQEFIEQFNKYLTLYEPHLQLFYRNLDFDRDITADQIRGALYYGDEIILIFLNAYPFNLQLFVINDEYEEAIDVLINYIIKNNIKIRGVQGSKKDCEKFSLKYYQLTKNQIRVFFKMDILVLEKLSELTTSGRIILANENHLEMIKEFYVVFCKEALNEDIEDEIAFSKVKTMIDNHCLILYENEKGIITSCLKYIDSLPNGYGISFVFTYKKYQGHGYAKQMMWLVTNELLKKKKYITLFVDQKNPISNHVYESIGFNKITDNYDCRIKL